MDDVKKRIEARYKLLGAFYKAAGGDPTKYTLEGEFTKVAELAGLDEDVALQAAMHLERQGLLRNHGQSAWALSHDGVCEYEQSVAYPDEDTEHFPASIVHYSFNISGGTVGAIQTGDASTANVAQQINAPPSEIARLLGELKQAAHALPTEKREEAIQVLEGMESEARSGKPKVGLVKSYAGLLNEYFLAYAPTIAMLADLILKGRGG